MKRLRTDPIEGEIGLAPPPLETTDRVASELLREANQEYHVRIDEPRAWHRLRTSMQARSSRATRGLYLTCGVAAAVVAALILLPAEFKARFSTLHAVWFAPIDSAPAAMSSAETPSNAKHDEPTEVTPSTSPQPLAQGRTRLADGSIVRLSPASDASVSARGSDRTTIDLSRGTVELQVAHQVTGHQLEVVSGAYRFVAFGTQFRVRTASDRVDLEVTEGTVGVMAGTNLLARIESGRSWSAPGFEAPNGGAPTAMVENPRPAVPAARLKAPPGATADPPPDCANAARAGRTHDAISCYEQQASKDGISAELAMYEIARLRKDVLSDFSGALTVLRSYKTRFPRGSLRGEVDVSALELLERLGRNDEVLSESKRLLGTPYGRERASAIHFLRGNVLRRALRNYAQAESEYAALSAEPGSLGDEAQFLRADCLERLGRTAVAAGVYGDYLRRPHARHAAEARARLSTLSP